LDWGVTLDELEGFGREGLLDAARSFNEHRDIPFFQWAERRIRSAMIDGVRAWGHLPQGVRRKLNALEEAQFVSPKKEKKAKEAALDVGLEEELAGLGDGRRSPEEVLAKAEVIALVREIVSELPEFEREIVERYHFRGETFDQVAAALGRDRFWAMRVEASATEKIKLELRRRNIDDVPMSVFGA
jgi:RNA polymerase sigma factor (sigma-70 family)